MSVIKIFRKRPALVEAVQFNGQNGDALGDWMQDMGGIGSQAPDGYFYIQTLENNVVTSRHAATVGDWIIRGVMGEFYACKPDIFAATYDAAENSPNRHETNDSATKPKQ